MFDFKDESGTTIAPDYWGKALRDGLAGEKYSGLCLSIDTNLIAACTDVNKKDYAKLWQGDAAFPRIESYPMPVDFGTVPAEGLVLAR